MKKIVAFQDGNIITPDVASLSEDVVAGIVFDMFSDLTAMNPFLGNYQITRTKDVDKSLLYNNSTDLLGKLRARIDAAGNVIATIQQQRASFEAST